MLNRLNVAALVAAVSLSSAAPASAAVISITHAKALAGNVTPGDAPGYPISLTVPGSFQVDSNLFVAANKIGIQVTSKNVTIDLNGFTLEGSNVAWYGITGGVNGVTINGGTIAGFKFDGIVSNGAFLIIEDMRIVQNGRHGISAGSEARIVNNTVSLNGGNGIFSGSNMHVEGNIVSRNVAHGVSQKDSTGGGTLLGNTLIQNAQWGAFVFAVGFGNNTILNNTAGSINLAADNLPLHPNLCSPQTC